MITIKDGDLLQATEDIIGHQVNCHGAAGGLAYHLFMRFTQAANDYEDLVYDVSRHGEQMNLLGYVQYSAQQPKSDKIIANLYGQYWPGADYRPDVLRRCLENLGEFARRGGYSVALPYGLSCGICGGNWERVYQMIEETMTDVQVTLYRKSN